LQSFVFGHIPHLLLQQNLENNAKSKEDHSQMPENNNPLLNNNENNTNTSNYPQASQSKALNNPQFEENKLSSGQTNKNQGNLSNKEEEDKKILNQEYYDKNNIPKYDDIINYENMIRQEVEMNSPLVSELLESSHLLKEYKSTIFESSILNVMKLYKNIRTIRRDGNCFYRSYIFRLFEEMSLKKDSKIYNDLLKTTENCKDFCEKNGYQWLVVEDFYNAFANEWKLCYTLDPLNLREYLKMLFQDKERCNYLIVFFRMFTAAYIKENRLIYEGFIEEDLDLFCHTQVVTVDVECDQIQMIAITNAFEYGVIIESIQDKKLETLKFPEESKNNFFINMLFRPGHYDILYK